MRTTPLLILAYNRPDKVARLVERLRAQQQHDLIVVVDGPKPNNAADAARVAAVQAEVGKIDWTDRIETRFRPVNLGLRKSVVDALDVAVDAYGEVIVIEEDVLPGRDFTKYMTAMLEKHRTDDRVAHISGYNIVPPSQLSTPLSGSRLSIYPESIAWATWGRAWRNYDSTLEWALNASTADLLKITRSSTAALRWKQHFADAASDRISTWAYRWIASMWSTGSLILSPNQNLVTYAGYDEGTNSAMKAPWVELPVFEGVDESFTGARSEHDLKADAWLSRRVFGGSAVGLARGVAISVILEARKRNRQARLARRGS